MAFNPFVGWTQAELEVELRSAQEELAAGASIGEVSAGDTSTRFDRQLSIERRIQQLYIALNALDSATYPLSSIVQPDRARVVFHRPINTEV